MVCHLMGFLQSRRVGGALIEAGLHKAAGGDGSEACAGFEGICKVLQR